MRNKLRLALSWSVIVLFVLQVSLVLLSWLLSAAMPSTGVHSMLSSEGLRWLFGRFVSLLCHPVLVWLLLLSIAGGAVARCGIFHFSRHSYRQRVALESALAFLALVVVAMLLLTLMPHAVLLSAVGTLFPSSFSHGLVPVTAFSLTTMSLIYGYLSGRFKGVGVLIDVLTDGVRAAAPLFVLYVQAVELLGSILFVF